MSEAKLNNKPNWAEDLENLSGLPGEAIADLKTSWESLEKRLALKSSSNKNAWYRVAAALILICCVAAFFIKTVIDKNSPVKTISVVKMVAALPPITTPELVKSNSSIRVRSSAGFTKTESHRNVNQHFALKAFPRVTPIISVIPAAADSFITNMLPAVQPAPVMFSVLKKKLPVVHINDLEKPATPSESVAENGRHPLRIKIFSQQQASSFLESNNAPGFIKINISPQN